MKKKIIGIVSVSIIALTLLTVGVLLFIKQKNIEETGNVLRVEWYDQDGVEFTITTKEQLYEFARLSDFYDFAKQTIKLGADIVVNEGNAKDWAEQAPAERWNPISGFAGRFDGQGHTISGLYGRGLNTPMALFIKTTRNCVIQDVKLVNSYFKTSGNSGTASFISNGGGKLTKLYSDAIIDCEGESSAGIASNVTGQSTFEECWYEGVITTTNRECGGLIDGIFGSRVTMKHCLFSGEINSTYGFSETRTGGNRTGGLVGRIDAESTLIINDSLCSGVINEDVNNQTGAFIGLAHGGAELMINDVYLSQDSFYRVYGKQGAGATATGSPLWIASENLKGTDAYRFTTLDFTKYWATAEEGPVLRCFADEVPSVEGVEKAYDLSWFDKLSMNNVIMDAKDLYGMYILSGTTDFTDSSVKLGADIVYNEGKASDWKKTAPEYNWYPIRSYSGIFDGQGHTISGIYIDWNIEGEQCGLFGITNKTSQIKNFSLKNSYITCSVPNSQTAVGSITGTTQAKIENIYSDAIIYGENSGIGGIIGSANGKVDKVVSNCWFDGEIVGGEKSRYQGGIVAYTSAGTLTIEHCLNSGNITTNVESAGPNAGGFLGMVNGGDGIAIKDSLNVGTVTTNGATNNAGSAIGYIQKERVATINHVYNILEGHKKEIGFQNGILRGAILTQKIDYMKGAGGYSRTTLDFKNYWSIVNDSTPILKTFATSSPSVAGLKREIDVSWYDADKDTYTLKTPEQLRAFAIMANTNYFKDKTVELGADIKFNEGNAAEWGTNLPAEVWTPIKRFDGTFDGQGHTVSGIYVKREDAGHAGLFGMAFGDIKNLKLTNSYFCHTETESGDSVIGSIVGVSRGNISNVYSDAIVVSHTKQASGGIVGIMNGDTDKVVSNVWFAGSLTLGETSRYGGGIVARTNEGTLKIEHCLNSGTVTINNKTAGSNTGGIIGGINSKSKEVVITDSLAVGVVEATDGSMTNNMGSIVGLIDKGSKLTISNTFASKESHEKTIGINNKGTQNGVVLQLDESVLLGYSGYQRTTLDFDKYWTVALNPESTPVLKTFAKETPDLSGVVKLIDLDWYDEDALKYEIDSVTDLYSFAYFATMNSFAGKEVILKKDIEVNKTGSTDLKWVPIENFAGTFNGNGHKISGLYCNNTTGYAGMFAKVSGAKIVDLRLEDSTFITTGNYAGSIAADGYGTFIRIYTNAKVVVDGGSNAGGIMGASRKHNSSFSECWFDGIVEVKNANSYDAGGILGKQVYCNINIVNCLNTGSVTSAGKRIGGFVGRVDGKSSTNKSVLTVADSLNLCVVTAQNQKGTALGSVNNATVSCSNVYGIDVPDGYVPTGVSIVTKAQMTGAEGYLNTNLDFETYWSARIDDVCTIKYFADEEKLVDLSKYIKADTQWYDEAKNEFTISTKEELYGFSKLAQTHTFEGKTIKLAKDIVINEGDATTWSSQNAPTNKWKPANPYTDKLVGAFRGTFDGQGHTISGLYATGTQYIALFGDVHPMGIVKNLRIENSYFYASNMAVASVAARGNGTFENIYSKAFVEAAGSVAGGIIGQINGQPTDQSLIRTISNCWFNGTVSATSASSIHVGGILGAIANATTTTNIIHCYNSGAVNNKLGTAHGGRTGGIVGNFDGATLIISDTFNSGDIYDNANATATGAIIGRAAKAVTTGSVFATTESYQKNDTFTACGTGTLSGSVVNLPKEELKGTAGYLKTTLNFENYDTTEKYDGFWTARNGNVPALRSFVKEGDRLSVEGLKRDADTSWYDTSKTEYTLWTREAFMGFVQLSQTNTFAGKKIKLGVDVVVNEGSAKDWKDGKNRPANWTIISPNTTYCFAGTFDGQGHTISGICLVSTAIDYAGLFGYIHPNGVVTNFALKNSYFNATKKYLGSVAGACSGTISNVYSDAYVVNNNSSGGNIGGIVGSVGDEHMNVSTKRSVTNCWFAGEISATGIHLGGIIGRVQGPSNARYALNVTVSYCLNTGTVNSTNNNGRVGGLIGCVQRNVTVNISNSLNAGELSGKKDVYGMVAYRNAANNSNVIIADTNYAVTQKATVTNTNGVEAVNVVEENILYSANKDNVKLDKNVWSFFTDKTPELTNLTKYLSK